MIVILKENVLYYFTYFDKEDGIELKRIVYLFFV